MSAKALGAVLIRSDPVLERSTTPSFLPCEPDVMKLAAFAGASDLS